MKNKKQYTEQGQTMVTLLIIVVMTIIVSTAMVVLIINNSQNTARFAQSHVALTTAESGAENAILRLLRDPSYSGETLTIDGNEAIVTVTSNGNIVIISEGRAGDFVRKVRVEISYISGVLNIISWEEII